MFKVKPDADGNVVLNGDQTVNGEAFPDSIEDVEKIVIKAQSEDGSPVLISNLSVKACNKPSKQCEFEQLVDLCGCIK